MILSVSLLENLAQILWVKARLLNQGTGHPLIYTQLIGMQSSSSTTVHNLNASYQDVSFQNLQLYMCAFGGGCRGCFSRISTGVCMASSLWFVLSEGATGFDSKGHLQTSVLNLRKARALFENMLNTGSWSHSAVPLARLVCIEGSTNLISYLK